MLEGGNEVFHRVGGVVELRFDVTGMLEQLTILGIENQQLTNEIACLAILTSLECQLQRINAGGGRLF